MHVYQSKQPDPAIETEKADGPLPLEVGTTVCVRNRFIGNWSSGFVVAEVIDAGYRIERLSDGLVFPDVFPFDDVRVERRLHPERGIAGSYLDRVSRHPPSTPLP